MHLHWPRLVGLVVLAVVPLFVHQLTVNEVARTAARIAFIYFFLMIGLRLMGKRELSEMSPFELVTLLMVPEIFSAALSSEDYSMTHATVGVVTLFVLVFLTSMVTFRFPWVDRIVEGKPRILVHDGRLIEENLRRERITVDEVFAEMHRCGLEHLAQVRWAILEVDGKIAIIPVTVPKSD